MEKKTDNNLIALEKFATCLCGQIISKTNLPTLILWMSELVLTKSQY